VSGKTEEKRHSVEETEAALIELLPAQKYKLNALARVRAAGIPGFSGDDLLQDVLARVLKGSRPWPEGVDIIAFMDQTMRSVASQRRRTHRRRKEKIDIMTASAVQTGDDADDPSDVIEQAASDDLGADQMLIAKQTLRQVEALFPEEKYLGVLLWRAEGHTPDEIKQEFSMDQTDYESASKLISRRLLRFTNGQKE